jgi:cytochrome c553
MIRALVRVVVLSLPLLSGAALAWEDRPGDLYQMCTQCHGDKAQGNQEVGAPSIGGLPEWYLAAQLVKFHTNVRGAQPKDINGMRMHPIGRTLDDSNIKTVAEVVAKLPRPQLPDTVKGSLVKGEAAFQVCTGFDLRRRDRQHHPAHRRPGRVLAAPG